MISTQWQANDEFRKFQISIDGEVIGKGRPRFTTKGGFTKTYTPKKTADYERLIKHEFLRKYPGYVSDKAIKVMVYACIKPAKSTSKRKLIKFLKNIFLPTKKPDIDNILKCVLDALNKVAYKDDAQVVTVVGIKRFNEEERLIIAIEEVGLTMQSA